MAKAKSSDKKESTSIALNARTKALQELIWPFHRRTLSQMVEIWTEQEAEKLGVSLPPDWVPPPPREKKPNKGKQ